MPPPTAECSSNYLELRKKLPVWKHKDILIEAINSHQHCIIVSSTGSGKTTQVPQFLYERNELSSGIIAITQPRRVAAISVALRVADEIGQGPVGVGPVGYCVRFEDVSDVRTTYLRYMTDGMLLRESILDPDLSRYQYVILDEAHERSLNTDVLFGVILTAAQRRARALALLRGGHTVQNGPASSDRKRPLPLLKIIVMSATIDPTPFVNFLGAEHTRVIYIEGRSHAIKLLTVTEPSVDYVADAAVACMQIHRSKTCPLSRGILIFLTGEEEICRCCTLLRHFSRLRKQNGVLTEGVGKQSEDLLIFPLFASLPQAKQMRALSFNKPNFRKVIVSTNLAETSVTIPGIRYVIDCGFAKTKYWDSTTGLVTFRVQRISKSQAWQRAGRAGRESAGVCLRLYTDDEYNRMPLHPQPELLRAPLTGVMLNLVSMRNQVPQQFPWLSRPSEAAMHASVELLEHMGAVERITEDASSFSPHSAHGSKQTAPLSRPIKLTRLGSLMSAFPLDPRFSRTILSAAQLGCLIEVLSVISMLYVSPVFYFPSDQREKFEEVQQLFRHQEGDLASLLQVYRAYLRTAKPAGRSTTLLDKPPSRPAWCKAHCLNRARLDTAIRVRAQLKQIVKAIGLGPWLTSCGTDLALIARAFLVAGFNDQVVVLAKSIVSTNPPHTIGQTRQPVYVRSVGSTATPCQFLIHPESNLYLASLSSPPPVLLFIEAVTQTLISPVSPSTTDSILGGVVYMRHVASLTAVDSLQTSADQQAFNDWLNQLPVSKDSSESDQVWTNRKRQSGDLTLNHLPRPNSKQGQPDQSTSFENSAKRKRVV